MDSQKEKVGIKNISNRRVGILVPELRLRRPIDPSKTVYVDKDLMDEAITYPGVAELFNLHYLIFIEDKDAESISSGYVEIPTEEEKMDFEDLKEIINSKSDEEFKKIVSSFNAEKLSFLVDAAVVADNITYSKAKIIQELTGIDISVRKKINQMPND